MSLQESLTTKMHPRMERERRTVEAMIALYCRQHHDTGQDLCPACLALREYAQQRLQRCPFQEDKPTCAKCPIHCYQPDTREEIKAVMRFAGPRMLFRHPGLALQHMMDGLRKEPALPHKARKVARVDPTSSSD